MDACSLKFKPEPSYADTEAVSSHPTNPHNHTQGGLWGGFMQYWDSYMRLKDSNPFLFWTTLILGHIVAFKLLKALWDKFKNVEVISVSSSTGSKAVVSSSPSWLSKNKGLIAVLAFLFAFFYFQDTWIPVVKRGTQALREMQAEREGFPNEFARTSFLPKTAVLTSPVGHALYGKELTVWVGQHAGRNILTDVHDAANGGYDNKMAILTDNGDYQLDQSVCNIPKIHKGSGRVRVTCIGPWKNVETGQRGTYDMIYGADNYRVVSLDTGTEPLIFQLK